VSAGSIRAAIGRIRGGRPGTYDSWLRHYHGKRLRELDAACEGAGPEALPLFRELDDDAWTLLLSGEQRLYPNIAALLPELPEPELQVRWNGASGLPLLNQSKAFYLRVKRICDGHLGLPLAQARVLDYGCGWGRLTRFFARDVAPGWLYGCDPVEEILDVCRRTRLPAALERSDFMPERLPFEERFDLVYAFSVFTHLSERAAERCLDAIHGSLRPGGLLVLTVRPPAYLEESAFMRPLLAELGGDADAALEQPRFLFVPHPADPEHPQYQGDEMTYGEAVITMPYIRERWTDRFELLGAGLLTEDLHQAVVALRSRD
jgi:SAM-dependent methyltransferase